MRMTPSRWSIDVVEERRAGIKLHAEAVVQIVIKIRAGGDDPVHEAGFHERNEADFPKARRRERAGEAHADEAVVRQHLFGEQLRRFAQAPAVVSEKGLVDQVGGGNVFADAERIEARIGRKFVFCHVVP